MIYLDYSATTPVSYDVLESYIRATRDFSGNPNSLHNLGLKSKALMNSAIKQISDIFNVLESEITFTSGATMSNNLALIGTALANIKKGNHIIVSRLEHPSIYKICKYLESIGFEVSVVDNNEEGLIDFEDLKRLVRDDTILVSINTIFHSDMTQALGKVPVNFHDVDLASITAHKIFGPKGIGLLYKKASINLTPILYGSGHVNMLNPGTPPVPLIVSFAKAIRLATTDLDKRENFVKRLNERVVTELSKYDGVLINQTKISIPHILNISFKNIKAETFLHALEEYEIYVSTNTACASGELSTSVMALYNDRKRASSTLRISLSYVTTTDEINRFLGCFKMVYQRLSVLSRENKE